MNEMRVTRGVLFILGVLGFVILAIAALPEGLTILNTLFDLNITP